MVDTNEIRRIFNELERQAKTLLNAANSFENALRDVDNSVDTRNFFRGIQDILWNFGFKNIRFTARSLERSLDNHYYSGRFGPDFNYSFYRYVDNCRTFVKNCEDFIDAFDGISIYGGSDTYR
jgi:hypothetical protein